MLPTECAGHLALQLDLQVEAAPGNDAFKATIQLRGIDLVVDSVELDVIQAIRSAAERCAQRLGELGYAVTADDVLAALQETPESLRTPPPTAQVAN